VDNMAVGDYTIGLYDDATSLGARLALRGKHSDYGSRDRLVTFSADIGCAWAFPQIPKDNKVATDRLRVRMNDM
jgi:hypothetical protein